MPRGPHLNPHVCHLRALLGLAMVAVVCASARAARAADPARPALDPTMTRLAYADDDWIVWLTFERVPGTERNVAPSYVRTYRLQRVGESTTRSVLRTRGTRTHDVVTVLPDGTIGVAYWSTLVWARPDGSDPVEHTREMDVPLVFEGKRFHVARGYPAGLFVQESAYSNARPVLFVPLEGTQLDWAKHKQVTTEPVRVTQHPAACLDGDLACAGGSVFDLETERRVELGIGEHNAVRALGAGLAASFRSVVRISDLATVDLPYWHQPFAIRHGVVYSARPTHRVGGGAEGSVKVFASSGTSGGDPTLVAEVRAVGVRTPYAHLDRGQVVSYGPVTITWNRLGIWLFDGNVWTHHDWLEMPPK
ncbi:MAG: hypothetical protein R3F05_18390 [Planctomycetota bacterium]|nr:hypothetical protein [Planctomycetota bacterium]MCB9825462.1 hypothetical protein [Planctomycetota bacterium]MCB9900556.1 hypothetical protein [Planctomycetota bacterium]